MKITKKMWAAIIAGGLAIGTLSVVVLPAPTGTPVCTEDMDCWDCSTMGNGVCGPLTVSDGFVVDGTGKVLGKISG